MKVALFIPCYVDLMNPEAGVSVARVLRSLGVEVSYPEGQTCCGQPAFNSGFFDEARGAARHLLLDVFGEGHADYVVCASGSCAAMVSRHYPELLEDAGEKAKAVALGGRVREFSDFLVNVLGVKDVGARFEGKAVFHPGCHQRRVLGVLEEPKALLRNVRGVDLVEWENEELCCGFGGTFAVKMPDVSVAMADEKVRALEGSGADTLVSCDSGCLMHLGGRLGRLNRDGGVRVMHLAQVLDPTRGEV